MICFSVCLGPHVAPAVPSSLRFRAATCVRSTLTERTRHEADGTLPSQTRPVWDCQSIDPQVYHPWRFLASPAVPWSSRLGMVGDEAQVVIAVVPGPHRKNEVKPWFCEPAKFSRPDVPPVGDVPLPRPDEAGTSPSERPETETKRE